MQLHWFQRVFLYLISCHAASKNFGFIDNCNIFQFCIMTFVAEAILQSLVKKIRRKGEGNHGESKN